jgi:hypothetical protein
VVVTAYDDGFVYIHDPDQEGEHETMTGKVHIPIPEDQFLKISRWGKARASASVIIFSE